MPEMTIGCRIDIDLQMILLGCILFWQRIFVATRGEYFRMLNISYVHDSLKWLINENILISRNVDVWIS